MKIMSIYEFVLCFCANFFSFFRTAWASAEPWDQPRRSRLLCGQLGARIRRRPPGDDLCARVYPQPRQQGHEPDLPGPHALQCHRYRDMNLTCLDHMLCNVTGTGTWTWPARTTRSATSQVQGHEPDLPGPQTEELYSTIITFES